MSAGLIATVGAGGLVGATVLGVVLLGGGASLQAQASCNVTTVAGAVAIEPGQTGLVRTIIGVGKARGVPQRGWVIATQVALRESGLHNKANTTIPASMALPHDGDGNDHDSVGVMQQRPSKGWGTVEQLMNPVYAFTAFYGGPDVEPSNPGLLDLNGWETMPTTVAAQRVQRSAYPSAYAAYEAEATQLVAANADAPPIAVAGAPPNQSQTNGNGYTGADGLCGAGGVLPVAGGTGNIPAVLAQAQRWLGLPYAWGGGTLEGPSAGFAQGAGIIGFDCSSYVRYAYFHGANLTLPRTSSAQYTATAGRTVLTGVLDVSRLQPGDLLFYGRSPGSIHHVAMYAGNGMVLEEPHTGAVARLIKVYAGTDFFAATRPLATAPVVNPATA